MNAMMSSRPCWKKICTALIVGFMMSGHILAAIEEDEGYKLAKAVYDRPDGADGSSRAEMILTEEGHEPRKRKMFSYRLDKGNGKTWSLIRFTSPSDIDGTSLLTRDYPGEKSEQWLFLPALDRARRISSSRKGGRFVGSDLYYEDLQDREVPMDKHKLLGKEPVGGVLCNVLESIPVESTNSVYSKRVSWVHPQTLVPLQVDYFEEGENQPIKRLRVRKIEKVQGYWTVMDSIMSDIESGHQTRIKVEKIRYDQGLNDGLFSRKVLEDPVREESYRP